MTQRKSEIVAIFNRYKDNFNNFINSSDTKSSNRLKLIDKALYNIFRFKNKSIEVETKLEENFLNKNPLKKLLQQIYV